MPKLKVVLTKEEYEKLDESMRQLYVEKDGKFMLDADVEDVSGLKSALAKEREEREEASKKLREITEKFADIDPEKAREALKTLQELEDKDLLDAGKVDELVGKKVERMKADYENQLDAFKKSLAKKDDELGGLNGKLSEVLIDNALREAATKAGVKATAIPDVILRGQRIWQLKDGAPTPLGSNGDVVYGKDPAKPMSMEEWLGGLSTDAPHLFEPSSGGGARNDGAVTGSVIRLTPEQAKDPSTYRSAKARAEKAGAQVVIG